MISRQRFIWKRERANSKARPFLPVELRQKQTAYKSGYRHPRWTDQGKSKGYILFAGPGIWRRAQEDSATGPPVLLALLYLTAVTNRKRAPGCTPCGVLRHNVLTALTELRACNKNNVFYSVLR